MRTGGGILALALGIAVAGTAWAQQESWAVVPSPESGSGTYAAGWFVSPSTGYLLYNPFSSGNPKIFKTTNSGTSWSPTTIGYTPSPTLTSITCPTATVCYATANAGIVKTVDGTSWSSLTPIPGASSLNAADFPVPDTGYVVASGTRCRTVNGGNTWSCAGSGANALHCLDPATCFAVGDGGQIAKTTNAGSSWSSLSSSVSTQLNSVHCPTAQTCFAVGANGVILKTSNGGANWDSSKVNATSLAGVRFTSADVGYATGYLTSISQNQIIAFKTINGGTAWFQSYNGTASTSTYPRAILFSSPGTAYLTGGWGEAFILRMTDPTSIQARRGAKAGAIRIDADDVIRYVTTARSTVRIFLRDVSGSVLRTLADDSQESGSHEVALNASDLAPGAYILDFRAGNERRSIPLTIP